jgi:hypothetical protein
LYHNHCQRLFYFFRKTLHSKQLHSNIPGRHDWVRHPQEKLKTQRFTFSLLCGFLQPNCIMSVLPLSSSTQAELVMRTGPGPLRCEFEDNAKGTVVYDNACNSVCFAEYQDARVFDKYASNLIDQKNITVRALEARISSECELRTRDIKDKPSL